MTDNAEPTAIEQRFRQMMEEVASTPGIEIQDLDHGAVPAGTLSAAEAFEELAEYDGIVLDPDMRPCVHRASEVGMRWQSTGEPPAGGEFWLIRPTAAVVLEAPDFLAPKNPAEAELYAQLRVIDYHPVGGTGLFTAFRLESGVPAPEIWYYNPAHGACELSLDYCGYVDALLTTRGFYHWQYLFADLPLGAPQFATELRGIAHSLEFLRATLPDPGYQLLDDRLADRT
jgi:hypothetical protein